MSIVPKTLGLVVVETTYVLVMMGTIFSAQVKVVLLVEMSALDR